jgi:hypothetical protein
MKLKKVWVEVWRWKRRSCWEEWGNRCQIKKIINKGRINCQICLKMNDQKVSNFDRHPITVRKSPDLSKFVNGRTFESAIEIWSLPQLNFVDKKKPIVNIVILLADSDLLQEILQNHLLFNDTYHRIQCLDRRDTKSWIVDRNSFKSSFHLMSFIFGQSHLIKSFNRVAEYRSMVDCLIRIDTPLFTKAANVWDRRSTQARPERNIQFIMMSQISYNSTKVKSQMINTDPTERFGKWLKSISFLS